MCRKGYHLRDQGMQPVQRFVSRCAGAKSHESRPQPGRGSPDRGGTTRRFAINTCKVPHICRTTFHIKWESSNHLREDKTMKKNLQRFGASVLAAAMVAQSVALPAAAETTKIDSSVAQSVAASAASAASAVQSLPKFTSTADLIKQTAQTLAAQGEVHELEQDDAKLEATAQSKAGMSLAALENALADAMYANAAAGKINTEAYGLNKDEMASVMAATIKTYHLSSAVTDLGYETNAAGVVTAVTFTGSSGMTSAMESMTNSDDEMIAQQAHRLTLLKTPIPLLPAPLQTAIPMASRNGTGMTPTRKMATPIPGRKPPMVTGPRPMTAGLTPLCIPVKRTMPTRR